MKLRLSVATARLLLRLAEHHGEPAAAAEVRAALDGKPRMFASQKRRRGEPRRSLARDAVEARAEGRCESCCAGFSTLDPAELDHFFGRARGAESERNTWLLHRTCHRAKTDNKPSATWWLERFIDHAERRGFAAEAERARVRRDARALSAASGVAGRTA